MTRSWIHKSNKVQALSKDKCYETESIAPVSRRAVENGGAPCGRSFDVRSAAITMKTRKTIELAMLVDVANPPLVALGPRLTPTVQEVCSKRALCPAGRKSTQ